MYERSDKNSRTKSVVFDSFAQIPESWNEICASDDLAMDIRVLRVFERTLADQCRCWGVMVFDASNTVIGCAALCCFKTEMFDPVPSFITRLRRRWPDMGRMKVLFCGLPVPSGTNHIRARDGCMEIVALEVDKVMAKLAEATRSRLTVFKELPDLTGALATALKNSGYVSGMIPPMHLLNGKFKDFAEYRDALKSRYRAQIFRSQKKLSTAGFEVVSGRGSDFFAKHFGDEVYALYVAVQSRAEQKLELMTPEFFLELAVALENEILLTLIRRGGKICAFTFAITRGNTHYNMYSGLDYNVNNEGDLYFNLFYADMDQAFKAGATTLHLGQTSDSFKSRLGTSTEKLWFLAHARPKAFNFLLRLVAPLAFPKVSNVEPNDVFAKP